MPKPVTFVELPLPQRKVPDTKHSAHKDDGDPHFRINKIDVLKSGNIYFIADQFLGAIELYSWADFSRFNE